jgi:asparagine N-glycosylation enzyme membrane subunit Stt3
MAPEARKADEPSRFLTAISIAGVFVLAAVARLVPFRLVFTDAGIRFSGDADVLYHVLRAERLLQGDFAGVWFDRNISFPEGAPVLWPPGFDALLAALALLSSGPSSGRHALESVAAILPVALGLACVALVMRVAWRISGRTGSLVAGLVFAVIPVCVEFGVVGRPDHHAAELAIFLFCLLAYLEAQRPAAARGWAIALGVGAALGAWTWQGSTLHMLFLSVCAATTWVVQPGGTQTALRSARTLRTASFVATALIAASILMLGRPGAILSTSLRGLTGFHAAALLAPGVVCAALISLGGTAGASTAIRRLGLLAAAAVAGAIAVWLFAPEAIRHGLAYIGQGNPFLDTVSECQPALLGDRSRFTRDLAWLAFGIGPALAAPLLAIRALQARWREDPQARAGLLVVMLGTGMFAALFFGSAVRFHLYLAPFLVLSCGLVVADLAARATPGSRLRRRWLILAVGAVVAFVVPVATVHGRGFGRAADDASLSTLEWLGGFARDHDRAVLAPWNMGHAIQYYARLPVTTSPFGTDVGEGGMRTQAAFYYARSPELAESILQQHRVGFVVLSGQLDPLADARAFAPPESPTLVAVEHSYWSTGRTLRTVEQYGQSIPGWLYEFDGVPLQLGLTTGASFVRHLYETSGGEPLKVFEVVPGARLAISGLAPGARAVARVSIKTNQGREFQWWTPAHADENGMTVIRVPYATGRNGASLASAVRVRTASSMMDVALQEADVVSGKRIAVDVSTTALPIRQ